MNGAAKKNANIQYSEHFEQKGITEMKIEGTNFNNNHTHNGGQYRPSLVGTEQGAVVASVGANNVTLEFKQKNKKPSWFFKCKLPNNTKLSCEQVGNTLTKLTLKKI